MRQYNSFLEFWNVRNPSDREFRKRHRIIIFSKEHKDILVKQVIYESAENYHAELQVCLSDMDSKIYALTEGKVKSIKEALTSDMDRTQAERDLLGLNNSGKVRIKGGTAFMKQFKDILGNA